jgi:uncharacterized C2H2 Zn-finger protein
VHEGLKAWSCDICGKKYANKPDLQNHLKKVHGRDVAFQCPHCDNKFDKKRDLMAHLEDVHEPEMRRDDP